MADKILIVDDEPEIADLVSLYLQNENFIVFKFYNAADALKCVQSETLDLAILDVMLPDMNGFQLCQKIREKYQYPVIMLTAKGEEIDKITGLTLGADDYITKPFLPLELVARVKAQLRRYKRYNSPESEEEKNVIIHSGLVLNIKTHFCNATGLHNPDHYSTVKDISILLKYALQYEDFRQAFSSSRYSTRPTNQHPDGFTFRSTMFKYMDSTEVVGGEIIGGKTGYTEEAGLCLASLAEVDGKEYILVTAKANGTHQTEQFHILDAINVYSQIGELNITN